MAVLQFLTVYFVSVTVSLTVDAQTPELIMPTNETKTARHPLERLMNENVLKNGNIPINRNIMGPKPVNLCLNPNKQPKNMGSTSNPISTRMPLILTRSRALPAQVPLVIHTQHGKPAVQYVRLNTNSNRQKYLKPKTEINKEIPRKKVTAVDKPKKQKKTSRKHKLKNHEYVEDDINFRSLPPAHKHSKSRKNNKVESDKEISDLRNGIYNDTRYDVFEIEPDSDIDDEDFLKNQTHAVVFTEESLPDQYENEYTEEIELNIDEKTQKPLPTITKETKPPLTPNVEDEVTVMIFKNDDADSVDESIDTITEPVPRQHPVINFNSDTDTPDIIIKGNEFEEFEERAAAPYPELMPINEDLSQPIPAQSWDNGNLFNIQTQLQNYQSAYDKYLKYLTKGNQNFNENDNSYPRANFAEPYPSSRADFIKTIPETRIIQDIYGPKPDFPNVIDIRPENAIGRVWRTWKGTEINMKNPKYFGNKPLEFGRSFNDMNYGGLSKTPALYEPQSIGINGYYNNLNNAMPYRYPCPYRYNVM